MIENAAEVVWVSLSLNKNNNEHDKIYLILCISNTESRKPAYAERAMYPRVIPSDGCTPQPGERSGHSCAGVYSQRGPARACRGPGAAHRQRCPHQRRSLSQVLPLIFIFNC